MNESTESTALVAPSDDAVENIRRVGQLEIHRRKELNALYKQLGGMTWGSGDRAVSGTVFSPQTRWALAEFCRVTGANALVHLDILGNKPYLNSHYWEEKVSSHILFHHYEQWDISPSVEAMYREKGLEKEADRILMARLKYSPRETATAVVETTIFRFINATPIEKIRAGEITDLTPFLVEVKECNWAGGHGDVQIGRMTKKDPIGDANPGTTARTRSLRRCATKAFSSWLAAYEQQITRAEEAIEAEFVIISEPAEKRDGPVVASLTSGMALPNEGEDPVEEDMVDASPVENEAPEFDATNARKRFFATFKDAGYDEKKDRKPWAKEHGLPESTKEWGPEEWGNAMEYLMAPTMDEVLSLVENEANLSDLSLRVLKKEGPEYLKDWNALLSVLKATAEAGPGPTEQQGMDL